MKIYFFPTVFLTHLYESMDLIIADMFEFICKDYYDSYYYLSSILLSPMLRLSHLWPVGSSICQTALVPFHEKWAAEIRLRVLTAISTVSFQWIELGNIGSTCPSMYLSSYLSN